MAAVMDKRQAKRRARCDDFYRSQTKKAQPAARTTPGKIVQASLADRPLADMPDALLTRLVADPEQVRGEYEQAGRDHHDLTQRQDAAETARARRDELNTTSDRLNEELTQVCDQRTEVTRVIAREDNRSLWSKMLGGQGVKRQAHQDLVELNSRRDSIRAQLQQLSEESSQQRQIISAAPTEQEENLSRHRVEDLRQAVDALESPEVIQAEATWRESADPKVAAVDRRRREPDLPPLAGDVMGSVYADQSDTWLAHALHARQQSPGTSSVEQSVPPPTPGRDLDDGMGL